MRGEAKDIRAPCMVHSINQLAERQDRPLRETVARRSDGAGGAPMRTSDMDTMRTIGRWASYVSPVCWPTARTEAGLALQIMGASVMMSSAVLAILIAGTPGLAS